MARRALLERYWATPAFTKERVRDVYSTRFKIHFPNEERAAGRPVRTRPAYAMQMEMGAIFGLSYGWEHPLWFSAAGEPREESIGSHVRIGGSQWAARR